MTPRDGALLRAQVRPGLRLDPLPAGAREEPAALEMEPARVELRMQAIDEHGPVSDEGRPMANQRRPLALRRRRGVHRRDTAGEAHPGEEFRVDVITLVRCFR